MVTAVKGLLQMVVRVAVSPSDHYHLYTNKWPQMHVLPNVHETYLPAYLFVHCKTQGKAQTLRLWSFITSALGEGYVIAGVCLSIGLFLSKFVCW